MSNYKLYSLSDLVDKTLYGDVDVDVYTNKPAQYGLSPVGSVRAGQPIGVLYSWVTDSDGTILFMFQGNNSNYANTLGSYFVKYDAADFDVQSLKMQGVLSIDEKLAAEAEEKRKANMTIGDYIKEIAVYGIIAFAVVALGKAVIDKKL